MSFLTRKPENAQVSSPAAAAAERQAGSGAEIPSGKPDSASGIVSGSASGTVSLAALYQAIADSQSQIAQYLLAREADVQNRLESGSFGTSNAGTATKDPTEASVGNSAGNTLGSGSEAFPSLSGNPAMAGELRQMAQQFPVILDRLNMLGQFMDQQMMTAITQRFDRLELLLKELPAVSGGGVSGTVPGSVSGMGVHEGQQAVGFDAVGGIAGSSADPNANAAVPVSETAAAQGMDPSVGFSDGMNNSPVPQEMQSAVSDPVPQAMVSQTSRSTRSGDTMDQLDKGVFGEMALEPSIQNERQYVLQGILAHDAVCSYLGGIMMMFQSSTPEKMVLLLKDLGEALYRLVNSLPENDLEQFEDSVARWAQWLCESAGLQNRIELVRPGQRFDSSRHNSASRGVTVTQVMGWVVLRGNGSVYSKALVDVQ